MTDRKNTREILMEIGLTENEIGLFIASEGNKNKQVSILRKSRQRSLDMVHDIEKNIQTIDYLIYEINNN